MQEIREGFAFVRSHTWLWGTLVSAAFAYLAFMGPTEVLLPYLVKNDLGGSASDLGLVFAAGGLGAILSAIICGARGLPRRNITWMYLVLDRGHAVDRRLRARAGQLAADDRVLHVQRARDGGNDHLGDGQAAPRPAEPAGPRLELRLADLDRPAAAVVRAHGPGLERMIGARATLIWAGIAGGGITLAALFLPGMREIEDTASATGSGEPETPPEALSPPAVDERRAA